MAHFRIMSKTNVERGLFSRIPNNYAVDINLHSRRAGGYGRCCRLCLNSILHWPLNWGEREPCGMGKINYKLWPVLQPLSNRSDN
ncbi:hypothetical protein EMIT0158MI4_30304 [Burkholderia ambifaria]